jgi:hypothetical protein
MAIQSTYDAFNPKEQNVEPGSYLKLFDSITQYQTESGLGTALKGAANLLDKGLDAANALVLSNARNKVENRIEPIVEDHTKNLEDARDYIKAKTRPIASQEYTTNLLPGPEGGAPAGTGIAMQDDFPGDRNGSPLDANAKAELNESGDYLDTLKAGVAQGKISDVYFKAAVANEAKSIRSDYPIGYRPEIDAMISAKMHTVQANPYIEALIHDINTSLTTGKAEKNATLGFIRTHFGVPGAEKVYDDVSNDRISNSEAMRRMAPSIQQDYLIKQSMQQLEYQGALLKTNTALAEKSAGGIASSIATQAHAAQTTAQGVTSAQLDQIAIDAANGTKTLTRAQAEYYAGQSKAIEQAVYNQTLAKLREVRTDAKTGEKFSYESLTSPDFVMSTAKKVSEHWANQAANFSKGDLSAATFQTRTMEAAKEETLFKVGFDHPEAMATLTVAKLLKENGVPEQMIHDTLVSQSALPKFNAVVAKAKYEIALPDELKGALPPGQSVRSTFKENLANIKAIYDANGIKYDVGAHSLTDFTKIIDGKIGVSLVNTNDPKMIDTIAHHVFGPGNENAFKYFNENYYDEKGRLIPGYQALYNRFSQPDVVKQIMKGSAQTKFEYNDFMTKTVREDILRNDLPKLKEYVNTPNAPYQIGWDTDTKNLKIEANPNVQETNALAGHKKQLNQTVNNINMTLDGLKSIAEGQGKKDLDVDAYVLSPVMQSLGDISDIKGLPSALALTIKGAYLKQRYEQEASQGSGNKDKYTNPPKAGK